MPVHDDEVDRLHQRLRWHVLDDRLRQDLHQVFRQADPVEFRAHESTARAVVRSRAGEGAMMMALRPLTAIMALLTGVAPGLVEGVIGADHAHGLGVLDDALLGSSSIDADRLGPQQVAQACRRSCAAS